MESYCPTKKVLDEYRYEEAINHCADCDWSRPTFTRIYANGHPTNVFATDGIRRWDYQWDGPSKPEILWYRDSGFAVWDCCFANKCCY